ncbi:MAG: ATP-binding protein [Nitrospinota bacterium]
MDRLIVSQIKEDLESKIVLLTGPRQTGKTTLSRMLFDQFDYFNYDLAEHRLMLNDKSWDRKKDLVVFDELHKKKEWKSWIKGIYDTEGVRPRLLVTGSAKLDVYKKMGDSLAGRFFQHRLHPFDIKELKGSVDPDEAFKTILTVGGFPEPFLKGTETHYRRWKKSHLDIILRQDLYDLENIRSIQSVETLSELLKFRVGSPVSYSSLARDLEVSPKTVKNWLSILENLYIIFKVTPYYKNISRSLLKEPKYYFYDTGQVQGDFGVKMENLVACALAKELHYLEDAHGFSTGLYYLRNKTGHEIDFLVVLNGKPETALEVKWFDDRLTPNFKKFIPFLEKVRALQLVGKLQKEKTYPDGAEIRKASTWLRDLDFSKLSATR